MRKNLPVYFLLCIIIFFGAWLRIAGILTNSFSFTYDVGRDMIEVGKIVNDYNFTLIGPTTGLPGLFYGPWWYYILSVPFFISGGNPQVIALFISFTGILAALLIYSFGVKIEGHFLGLILAYFVSFSPVMVGISSQIWNPNLIPFLVVLVLLLMHKIFLDNRNKKNGTKKYFLLLGLILGLILDLEIVFGLLFLIGVFLSMLILLPRKINIKLIFFIIIGFLFIIFPRLLFETRHNFVMTKSVINSSSSGEKLTINNSFSYFHMVDVLKALKNLFDSVFVNQNATVGFIVIALFLITVLFFYKNISQEKKFYLKFVLVIILTFFIGLSFLNRGIWKHYLIGLPVIYILPIGIFILIIRKYYRISIPVIFMILTGVLMLYLGSLKFFDSFKPLWEGNAAVYRNQIAVIDYIYRSSESRKFNYITYTPVVHDYTYRYLFSWYGKKKYGYTPSSSKEDYFFLIIEPEYDRPFLLKEWLSVRRRDGRKIKSETVKGGIVVETRIH